MISKSKVVVKRKTDYILIKTTPEDKYEDILASLKKKLAEIKKIYEEEAMPIRIVGKILKNKETQEVVNLINDKLEKEVEIEFDIPKTLGLHSIKMTYNQNIEVSETKFYRGSLRSGQRMEYKGSLVVMGDVNAGAEVIATENIVVLGTLRGLAHAGAKGNKDAIIAAGRIDTAQMRIANIVKEFDRAEEIMHKQSYCYVSNDLIVIE